MTNLIQKIIPKSIKKEIREQYLPPAKIKNSQKIFGIGNNKTGTTSLKVAMKELGFIIGDQRTAENLIHQWAKRDFKPIVSYCKSAQFFQDIPFSRPYTYVILDHEFPNSKFILTVRDNSEQWYESLIKFQSKLWGKEGRIPTKEDLMNAPYIYKGFAWETRKLSMNIPDDDPYNKEMLIAAYEQHNEDVKEYFRHRPEDLLVLNVAESGAYQKLCKFLGVKSESKDFPWENRTTVSKQQK